MTTPDAVEAAARALCPGGQPCDDCRSDAEIALAAAAPLIAKQALLDTADLLKPYSPVRAALAHQSGPTVDASWLRAHANTLTPKEN